MIKKINLNLNLFVLLNPKFNNDNVCVYIMSKYLSLFISSCSLQNLQIYKQRFIDYNWQLFKFCYSKTRFRMSKNIIQQINANHEVLLSKIANIEAQLAQRLPALSNLKNNASGDNFKSTQIVDEEKHRLQEENAKLKNEIKTLTEKLMELTLTIDQSNGSKATGGQMNLRKNNKNLVQCSNDSTSPPVTDQNQTESKTKVQQQQQKKPEKEPKKQSDSKSELTQKPKENKTKAGGKQAENVEERAIDASRLDLRVGKIIDVKKHPDADSLYVEQIECGEDKPRTVVSGLVKFVPIEQMQNRMVIILCNLKPAKMRGVVSEAMVMCASTPEKVEILLPPEGSVPGDRVSFEKYPGEPDQQLNPKKKIWEQIAPSLTTNGNLEATYKGDLFLIKGKGPVKAETLKNVQIK